MTELMRNLIKPNKNNPIRRNKYVKSRKRAATVVNMGTIVDIVWIENNTIILSTTN